jgi:heme/copper-type cytochrome/quinol oxidase subunit 2
VYFITVTIITDLKINLMAEIHVQARRHSRSNPTWMWTWLIVGILIIAAVAYFVFANKDKANSNNNQDLKNQRNTPMPGAAIPQQSLDNTYVIRVA